MTSQNSRRDADEDRLAFTDVSGALEALRAVPPRLHRAEQAGLRAVLDEAARLGPAVSASPAPRHNGWTLKLNQEGSLMFALVKLALVFVLGLGGVGATASAAQSSLPNEALYPIKLVSEDARLRLAPDLQARIAVLLDLTRSRVSEMTRLAAQGQAIPEEVPLRLQAHLETALHTAAQLGDPQMQGALEQIRRTVEAQEQAMIQAQEGAPAEIGSQLRTAERLMAQTREMCDLGLRDPAQFRERDRDRLGPSPEATPCGDCIPQADQNQEREQNRRGPAPSETPVPSGNGPGPQATPCADCTPQGDQNREQNRDGPQPSGTPEPDANGNGPGPQPTSCGECTPQGDQNQNQNGPQPITTPHGDGSGPGPQPTAVPGDGQGGGPQATASPAPGNGNGSGSQSTPTDQSGGNGRP